MVAAENKGTERTRDGAKREAPTRGHFREYGAEGCGAESYEGDSRGKTERIRDGAEARSAVTEPLVPLTKSVFVYVSACVCNK